MARITSISSLGWAHYTLYEALPKIVARGFKRVEIASFYCYCFHLNYGSPTPAELKNMLRDAGLELVGLNWCPDQFRAWMPEDAERFVAAYARKLEHLAPLGVPLLTMVYGIRNQRNDQQQQLENSVRVFNRVGALAKQHGTRMILELPHLYTIVHRPEQLTYVLDRVESDHVGVLLDSSHWGIIGYDLEGFIAYLGDRLWHVHLRDSAGPDTADQKQDLEKTPGSGVVDFQRLARALDAVNYAGDVSLEFEYRDMTLDDIEKEYDKGLTYLRECGWELPPSVRVSPQNHQNRQ